MVENHSRSPRKLFIRSSLVLLILIGFYLRIKPALHRPLLTDEALVIDCSVINTATQLLLFQSCEQSHPPLFYVLISIASQFCLDIIFLRTISIVIGVSLIVIGYKVGVEIVGKLLGLVISSLISFDIFLVDESWRIRMYNLSTLLFLLAYYSYVRWKKGLSFKWFLLLIVFGVIAIYTDFGSVWFVLPLFLLIVRENIRQKKKQTVTIVFLFVVAVLVTVLLTRNYNGAIVTVAHYPKPSLGVFKYLATAWWGLTDWAYTAKFEPYLILLTIISLMSSFWQRKKIESISSLTISTLLFLPLIIIISEFGGGSLMWHKHLFVYAIVLILSFSRLLYLLSKKSLLLTTFMFISYVVVSFQIWSWGIDPTSPRLKEWRFDLMARDAVNQGHQVSQFSFVPEIESSTFIYYHTLYGHPEGFGKKELLNSIVEYQNKREVGGDHIYFSGNNDSMDLCPGYLHIDGSEIKYNFTLFRCLQGGT